MQCALGCYGYRNPRFGAPLRRWAPGGAGLEDVRVELVMLDSGLTQERTIWQNLEAVFNSQVHALVGEYISSNTLAMQQV